ncbi:hypothetical protein KIN20_035587 [Parelaphostrongylus tenuis]|uniref:Uncharacterized protein n=1 Tax=Parelaphostrongylus tenuis TaxID=148309 RepID=A0AAD5RBC8_PARTN|nr:hypothetical protein KIN20_035587 [Parelaphostrongylus tenuis]
MYNASWVPERRTTCQCLILNALNCLNFECFKRIGRNGPAEELIGTGISLL